LKCQVLLSKHSNIKGGAYLSRSVKRDLLQCKKRPTAVSKVGPTCLAALVLLLCGLAHARLCARQAGVRNTDAVQCPGERSGGTRGVAREGNLGLGLGLGFGVWVLFADNQCVCRQRVCLQTKSVFADKQCAALSSACAPPRDNTAHSQLSPLLSLSAHMCCVHFGYV
jgi:hypothetical protein